MLSARVVHAGVLERAGSAHTSMGDCMATSVTSLPALISSWTSAIELHRQPPDAGAAVPRSHQSLQQKPLQGFLPRMCAPTASSPARLLVRRASARARAFHRARHAPNAWPRRGARPLHSSGLSSIYASSCMAPVFCKITTYLAGTVYALHRVDKL